MLCATEVFLIEVENLIKRFSGSPNLQVKLVSAHQAEIQFARNLLVKAMGAGEDYCSCHAFGI